MSTIERQVHAAHLLMSEAVTRMDQLFPRADGIERLARPSRSAGDTVRGWFSAQHRPLHVLDVPHPSRSEQAAMRTDAIDEVVALTDKVRIETYYLPDHLQLASGPRDAASAAKRVRTAYHEGDTAGLDDALASFREYAAASTRRTREVLADQRYAQQLDGIAQAHHSTEGILDALRARHPDGIVQPNVAHMVDQGTSFDIEVLDAINRSRIHQ